ncbi:DUF6879 family protein [Kutzneria buriramensis]|uniref:DUF6879 domain-containing protein n=1 Tax=Kutzneria buriramensis TaxID=1045776 RepID=A0A3E0HEJ6_9PSEU|nr:DUF6879 family protein [Kutzneria buriramensis]REH43662.1 hypothetical protein BCF44_109205 [Kutzneria buriramensis]
MTERLDRSGFQALVTGFERSAWRLEIQGWYDEPDEGELVAQWLADGDPAPTLTWFADWPAWIAEQGRAGKRFERVRVLTDPLTDYLRWQLDVITEPAIAAGEDIRVLPAAAAADLELGGQDFYILDDRQVAVLDFDGGQVIGARLLDSAADMATFRAIRATAWDHAERFREYRRARA